MDMLSQGYKHKLIDLLRDHNKGVELVTFADSYFNDLGEECPTETELTVKDELMMRMCLDFIFELRRDQDIL